MRKPDSEPNPTYAALVAMQDHAKIVKYKKGETVLHPHEDTTNLYVICTGLVKVYTINARGEEAISVIFGADDMFPLAWIIGQRRQHVFFQAMSDCEIALFPQDLFLEHMQNSPELTYAVMNKVVEQFVLYASRVTNLELKYGRERLAYRLLVLAGRFGKKHNGFPTFPYISQHDLGATLNMSRESVSREMSRLERLGMIEYTAVRITIKNAELLRAELGDGAKITFFDKD